MFDLLFFEPHIGEKSAQEPEKARFGHITLKLISAKNFDKVLIYVP